MNTYSAEAKNLKASPRKMRLVVDGIKNMQIPAAVAVLSTISNRSALPIKKVLESAIANAAHNGQIKKEELFISEMFVNEGISYKRFHFAGRGRTRPYKKRTSHVKVILGVKVPEVKTAQAVKKVVKKEEKPMKEVRKGKEEAAKKNKE